MKHSSSQPKTRLPVAQPPPCYLSKLTDREMVVVLKKVLIKDLLTMRFVCKATYTTVRLLLTYRQYNTTARIFNTALNTANLFYEESCPRKLKALWCCDCHEVKDNDAFPPEDTNPNTRGNLSYWPACWDCLSNKFDTFKHEGKPLFLCIGACAQEAQNANTGYWQRCGKYSHDNRKICGDCWHDFKSLLRPEMKGSYHFLCGRASHHAEFVPGAMAYCENVEHRLAAGDEMEKKSRWVV